MATVTATGPGYVVDAATYVWTPLTTTNADGSPAGVIASGDRTVQVQGTFGTGGTLVVEGTLDGSTWYTLRDPQGTSLSFTAAGLKAISENVLQVRPRVTGGDGTTSLTAIISVRRIPNV